MRGANPSPSPKRQRRQALFAVSVLSTLLVAQELLLRFLFPIPPVHGFNRIHYQMLAGTSPTLRQSLRRGLAYVDLRFISRPDGFDHRHRLNLFGFRGSDFSIDRPADRRRVIVLGDSVAEGQGASESATIAAHLSRHWPDAEVLNLGVVAADLPRLAHLAHDAIPLLRPTDVVLVLSANDLPAPFLDPSRLGPSRSFPRNTTPPAFPHAFGLVVRILSHQPIYRRWPRPTLPFFPAVPAPTNPWTHVTSPPADIDPDLLHAMTAGQLNPWLAEQADAIPGMLAHDFSLGGSAAPYLQTIAAYCRQVQARLLVAYVPFCGVVHRRYADVQIQLGMAPTVAEALPSDPIYRRQNHHLDEVCARLRLPLVDTTEPLQAADQAGTLQYWPYDTHPTPQGYATIAQAIASAAARAD